MSIDKPRFPTPEDERRASLLYQALRAKADIDDARGASSTNQSAEAGRSPVGR
jgi:hypothetical protein